MLVPVVGSMACSRAHTSIQQGPFRDASVVLISIDTLRADRLPTYGYRAGATPTLDRLAREGILFEDLYSHCPLTLPSHASLLTGLLPFRHGVRDNIGFSLKPNHSTLAGRFKSAGYATGGAVSAYVLRHQTGIAAGFDFFDDRIEIAGTGESLSDTRRDGQQTVERLAAWIGSLRGARFFAFLHLYEPHAPYVPPPSHQMADSYDGSIAYADELVGRFLQSLEARDILDRSIVTVVSDHGEGLRDHDEAEHGILLYREALHVPWLLRLPGRVAAGSRVKGPIGEVDVAATLVELAGLPSDPDHMDGRSVATHIAQGRVVDRTVYAESLYPRLHFGWSQLAAATEGRYRYIRAPRPELFDLTTDPRERVNLAEQKRDTGLALAAWLEHTTAGSPIAHPEPAIAEVRERLKALGYFGSSSAPSRDDSRLPDPKEEIRSLEGLKHAQAAANAGRDEEAIAELRRLVNTRPGMLDAWESLAKALVHAGRTGQAIEAFGHVLDIDPLKPETHLALARILALEQQPVKAREHAELAARRDPAAAHEILAELMMDAGRIGEAASYARQSIDEDPSLYMSHFVLGVTLQRQGQCGEAIREFERTIDAKRTDPNTTVRGLHAGLADCLAKEGRQGEAEREFRAEIASIPWSPEGRVGLAALYRSQGLDDQARQVLAGLVESTPHPSADTYFAVVHTLTVLGDHAAARQWAARARAKFPGDPRFR